MPYAADTRQENQKQQQLILLIYLRQSHNLAIHNPWATGYQMHQLQNYIHEEKSAIMIGNL